MNKVIRSTSRGQVTLPKKWRDKYDTNYFNTIIEGDSLIIKPLETESFIAALDKAWGKYQSGEFNTQEDLMKKYGL